MPSPLADRRSRWACRRHANGTPPAVRKVSKTPSPINTPWSTGETRTSSRGSTSPLTQTCSVVIATLSSAGLAAEERGRDRDKG